MKVYSELLKKEGKQYLFDTFEECEAAEEKFKNECDAKRAAEEKKKAEYDSDVKELDRLYDEIEKAYDAFIEKKIEFDKKYYSDRSCRSPFRFFNLDGVLDSIL